MTHIQSSSDAISHLAGAREQAELKIHRVPFPECADWHFSDGRLRRAPGDFFTVAGIDFDDVGDALTGTQLPMIDQPEIGWLGFIVRPAETGLEWLLQAKTEPGNVGDTHYAPTIQATKSNYLRKHGGCPTAFLGLFQSGQTFAADGIHSEQGTRFLWKFNRNSTLIVGDDAPISCPADGRWFWCSTDVLRDVLAVSHALNTDARSVIATSHWPLLSAGCPLFRASCLQASYHALPRKIQLDRLLGRTQRRSRIDLPSWKETGLAGLEGYELTGDALIDPSGEEALACYCVEVNGREVSQWCQPFLMQSETSEVTLFMRIRNGIAEFFLRVFNEPGFGDRREFGPSLHSSFATPQQMKPWQKRGTTRELMMTAQSDEGGRFMQVKTNYRIVLLEDVPDRPEWPFGVWVGLSYLEQITTRSGKTTNELRTLVSMILSNRFDQACEGL